VIILSQNFVEMGVGRGRICLTSFSSPTAKSPTACKNLGDISYASRGIVDFVSKFVAVATKVVRRKFLFIAEYLIVDCS